MPNLHLKCIFHKLKLWFLIIHVSYTVGFSDRYSSLTHSTFLISVQTAFSDALCSVPSQNNSTPCIIIIICYQRKDGRIFKNSPSKNMTSDFLAETEKKPQCVHRLHLCEEKLWKKSCMSISEFVFCVNLSPKEKLSCLFY